MTIVGKYISNMGDVASSSRISIGSPVNGIDSNGHRISKMKKVKYDSLLIRSFSVSSGVVMVVLSSGGYA
ncbi:MAG: hypothetical protein DRP46_11235 [Candidatus Zixiibacteriota bacterium]|nr:MAG: hypothetical protein DRP46_11235 [candidate division Zixibacteria bacterium]